MPAAPHEENTGGRGEDLQFPGVNVLVCEDNDLNAEIVQTILSDYKINVITAVNGRDGVEKFARSQEGYFGLVLMDIMMPKLNGLDATRKIRILPRADSKTVPIVAMSANAFDEDKKRSLARGMNAHLSKEDWDGIIEETPVGRIGAPEDIAEAVAFLAGEKASYITGAVLNVNGGSVI